MTREDRVFLTRDGRELARPAPPEVRWAPSPHDGRCHAMPIAESEHAPLRGWADALCGMTLPAAGLEPTVAPHGRLCWPCALEVPSELPDPGRFGGGR